MDIQQTPQNKADGLESSRLGSTWMKTELFMIFSASCCLAANNHTFIHVDE
jgi:hypothetical protein